MCIVINMSFQIYVLCLNTPKHILNMFIYLDLDFYIESHNIYPIVIYSSNHTQNTKLHFQIHISFLNPYYCFPPISFTKQIYLREPTRTKKAVEDYVVLFLITFLIQPFTNQLI